MKTYYDLLTKPVQDLTYDEKVQLQRAEKIPPAARRICEVRVNELISEIIKLEKEKDELSDWLNGIDYDPNGNVPF